MRRTEPTMRRLLALAFAGIVATAAHAGPVCAAEEGQAGASQPTSRIDRMVEALKHKEGTKLAPDATDPAFLDEQGRVAQQRAFRSYYDYRTEGFDHRRRVFEWQLFTSKIIFAVVVALVAIGIFFSWLQFRRGLGADGNAEAKQETTTIEATAKGIKVSSPVLGVIILTISLAFFYLYLVYVYPIEEIL